MPHRTIAIGDIHGCALALAAVIDAIDPGPEDVLVVLGDYIDRGPDSRGVIDLLIELGRRCRLVPLLGNHEELLLEVEAGRHPLEWLLGIGGTATLDSYGPGRELHLIPEKHIEFLEGCLDYHETATHIFLHANYDPDLPMDQQPWSRLRWESLRTTIPAPHRSGKTVIVGHTAQTRRPDPRPRPPQVHRHLLLWRWLVNRARRRLLPGLAGEPGRSTAGGVIAPGSIMGPIRTIALKSRGGTTHRRPGTSVVAARRGVTGIDAEARIEGEGPIEVEPCAIGAAEAGVGEGSVVIADGLRGEGDARPEGVDRLGVAAATEGALAAIELGPQALGLQFHGAVEGRGGRLEVAVAEQGAAEGVAFPRACADSDWCSASRGRPPGRANRGPRRGTVAPARAPGMAPSRPPPGRGSGAHRAGPDRARKSASSTRRSAQRMARSSKSPRIRARQTSSASRASWRSITSRA